jgi:hypothetical protein
VESRYSAPACICASVVGVARDAHGHAADEQRTTSTTRQAAAKPDRSQEMVGRVMCITP